MRFEIEPGLTLTTEHGASSYGLPVLVDQEGLAHGPADGLAGSVVRSWASQPERTAAECEAAGKFLSQLP